MHIEFWGTRGSIAKPGPTTLRYGGNTSCVEVRTRSGTLIVLDCGTGAHALGQHLTQQPGALRGHLLISHTHWDHIQGLPFFAPLFVRACAWDLYGPKGLSQSLRATLAGQMEHTYFPITLDQFAAQTRYHDLVEGAFSIDEVHVTARYLNHPALTLGYRLEVDGASLVYCCDHEPYSAALASGEAALTGMDRQYADFVAGADLVIHDAQYTAEEYPSKIGWGHSPVEYVVRLCRDAGVKRLALTHHDPLRTDADLDRILENLQLHLRDTGAPLEILAAAEGLALQLAGSPGTPPGPEEVPFGARTPIDPATLARPVLLRLADPEITKRLGEALAAEHLAYRVLEGEEDLRRGLREDNPALVMIEHDPPRIDGLEIARTLRRAERPDAARMPIVLVTPHDAAQASEDGLDVDWLIAPFSLSYARARIRARVLHAACRWIRAHPPADEDRRVAALHGLDVLDTPAEERFDRLTRIVAAALDVPIALVTLVDSDRQWFKSHLGLDLQETSRELSFCAFVVQQGEELAVRDTLLDDRFADNPLVLDDPRIRAYTGAPLFLDDGSCIGTLCAIDTRPRAFSAAEQATLRDLRDLALEEIKRTRPRALKAPGLFPMTPHHEYNAAEHALHYLAHADRIPHRAEGEAVLLEFIPASLRRVLDLGTGDGRLLARLRAERPGAAGVAADVSPTMLEAARARFAGDPLVRVAAYDLDEPLVGLGRFDAVVSSFAIHHCSHARKRTLYAEIFQVLEPGGVFYNLEHVASATPELHAQFLEALGLTAEQEDRSNQLLEVELQLAWLREIGFEQVDCHWKWRELALFGGVRPHP